MQYGYQKSSAMVSYKRGLKQNRNSGSIQIPPAFGGNNANKHAQQNSGGNSAVYQQYQQMQHQQQYVSENEPNQNRNQKHQQQRQKVPPKPPPQAMPAAYQANMNMGMNAGMNANKNNNGYNNGHNNGNMLGGAGGGGGGGGGANQYNNFGSSFDARDMYSRPEDSESEEADENDADNEAENMMDAAPVSISVIGSQSNFLLQSDDNEIGHGLPQIPNIPVMVEVPDVDIKPEQQELVTHCGFVTKLNARLVELNARTRLIYPKLAADLVQSQCRELFHKQYESVMGKYVESQRKSEEYERQIQALLPLQEFTRNLNAEVQRLRSLNANVFSKQQQRAYINEIEQQLTIYREKVIFLSQQSQSFVATLKNSVNTLTKAQEDLNDAHVEIKALGDHVTYLEEASQDTCDVDRLRQEMEKHGNDFKEKEENMQFELSKVSAENATLKEELDRIASEKVANEQQREEHAAYQYKQQLQQLEERLSKMTVTRIQQEDEFVKRQKIEQERADKYRAKYESVKQHVKTLELQKSEYTKVNLQLRQQNNQFRSMITQLQQNLKKSTEQNKKNQVLITNQKNTMQQLQQQVQQHQSMQQQQQQQQQQHQHQHQGMPMNNGMNAGGMNNGMHNNGGGGNDRNFQLQALQQKQQQLMQRQREMQNANAMLNGMKMGVNNNNNAGANKFSSLKRGSGIMNRNNQMNNNGMGGGNNNELGGMNALSNMKSMPNGGMNNNGGQNNGLNVQKPPPIKNGHKYAKSVGLGLKLNANPPPPPQQALQNSGDNSISKPVVNDAEKEVRMNELWGKRTQVISEKGSKKRILVEWHFVTSDKQPHTVVLQHTQDTKPKTRRMLWVDGSEKYNNKSSASSFRIEIDRDVVVVSIDYHDNQYQYRLNINTLNYQEAFQLWKANGCPI